MSYLKMRTRNRLGKLIEQGFLNFGEFIGIHDLKNVFHFIEKHDLFGAVSLWPIAKQT